MTTNSQLAERVEAKVVATLPSQKLAAFLNQSNLPTPFLVVDVDIIAEKYRSLQASFPDAHIYYAIKANPAPAILQRLNQLSSAFDAASVPEIDLCLAAGIPADRISYGNTIKKSVDIAEAFARGVRLYTFDSLAELEKIATNAPGAQVCCRILVETIGAEWPLAKKFGCDLPMAYDLLKLSSQLGLIPYGVAFHVGSQQTDPTQWRQPIQQVADLFAKLAQVGINLTVLNIGGGLPAQYRRSIPAAATYATAIQQAITAAFGDNRPELMLEPGRSLVGDAGVLQTEVVLISRKSYDDDQRWVYLDIGKFGGLIETLDESIKYAIRTPYDHLVSHPNQQGPVILAGPTCDSADVLYEDANYELPLNLQIGDRLEILSTGAYTTTYSAVAFNGFEPLRSYYI
jgi:ornithine decarboxylase